MNIFKQKLKFRQIFSILNINYPLPVQISKTLLYSKLFAVPLEYYSFVIGFGLQKLISKYFLRSEKTPL